MLCSFTLALSCPLSSSIPCKGLLVLIRSYPDHKGSDSCIVGLKPLLLQPPIILFYLYFNYIPFFQRFDSAVFILWFIEYRWIFLQSQQYQYHSFYKNSGICNFLFSFRFTKIEPHKRWLLLISLGIQKLYFHTAPFQKVYSFLGGKSIFPVYRKIMGHLFILSFVNFA